MTAILSLVLALGAVGSVQIGGTSTWYCSATSPCTAGYGPSDAVAAIDPSLGIAKGSIVTVTGARGSRAVRIVDVCACKGSRIIDLTSGMFRAIVGPLSQGTGRVTVTYGGGIRLPDTDTVSPGSGMTPKRREPVGYPTTGEVRRTDSMPWTLFDVLARVR